MRTKGYKKFYILIGEAIIVLAATIFVLTSCSTGTPSGNIENAQDANSEWPKELVIVQMPDENNPDAGTLHDGFRTAMEEYLGIAIKEIEGSEYTVGIEALKAGKLDILLVTPMSYYQADRVANIEPLVTTTTAGAPEYRTVFITKSDRDDINSFEDLQDKTFAFVDPASSSGYMFPKAKLLAELNLDTEQLENPGYFFKTVTFSGKHDSSIMGVTMGDYDAAAVAQQTLDQLEQAGLINKDDLKIIGETDIIPSACFIMRKDLPQDLKDKIKDFYLTYNDSTYFEAFYQNPEVRFIEAKDSDYAIVTQMVELLKIEE